MSAPIRFFSRSDEFAWLSNFSPHGFTLLGEYWPTVEHCFQAAKFLGDEAAEHRARIRNAASPKHAKSLGQSRKYPIRADWEEVKESVMLVPCALLWRPDFLASAGERLDCVPWLKPRDGRALALTAEPPYRWRDQG